MARLEQKPEAYLNRNTYATRDETVANLISRWKYAKETERVDLAHAAGRTCARTVCSCNSLPIHRAAAADGVAVRYADFVNGVPDFSRWQEGKDYIAADMGDDFNDAFDTVLWVEDFTFAVDGGILEIRLEEPLEKGHLVRPRGSVLREEEQVLKAGDIITPFRLGLLAAAGISHIDVLRRPVVAYLPTGSELVPPGKKPLRGQNIETNGLMVEASIRRWGADILRFPIVQDTFQDLEDTFTDSLKNADIVLLNGGTSMGTEDYTSIMLKKKASYFQHGVRSIPGIPVAVAIVDGKPVVNLPGPPFAAFCALDWCVNSLIANWYGYPRPVRQRISVKLDAPIRKPPAFEMYIRLSIRKNQGNGYIATPISRDARYADVANRWNGLFIAPIGTDHLDAGEVIEAEVLSTEAYLDVC